MYLKRILRLHVVVIGIVTLLISCRNKSSQCDFGKVSNGAENVSIVNIIATPARYDGKVVRANGVLTLEFEGNAIYITKADAENHVSKNSIWLDLDYSTLGIPENKPSDPEELKRATAIARKLKNLSGKYVLIEGIFDKNSNGHLGLFSGSIKVTRIAHFGEKKQ